MVTSSVKSSLQDTDHSSQLTAINYIDHELQTYFRDRLVVEPALSRALVSFQANKSRPIYRWYKYKEAFSADLVEFLLQKYPISTGTILDPFAGSGTALFAAGSLGLDAVGIELLPIGQEIINTKKILDYIFNGDDIAVLHRWAVAKIWRNSESKISLPELRITKGAYPSETKREIEQYLSACVQENDQIAAVLRFALLCVLESISFTRKDGQYLRWDYRSGRKQGAKEFNKGAISSFDHAVSAKLIEIMNDLSPIEQTTLFALPKPKSGHIHLYNGSCLEILPSLLNSSFDGIITSPPYCNRYDYTRTYALELALLGTNEKELVQLRQTMLSCTVENKAKDLLSINPHWFNVLEIVDNEELLQLILYYLEDQKIQGKLNNSGIPRMVRGYFYEMACMIAESARVLKPNARLLMINDNVRYAGVSIPVDLILASIAEKLGFFVEEILILPNGKGNSSQQMGEHGRDTLRKCVYIWRKQ